MAKGGSHKPTNFPYLIMSESSTDEAQSLIYPVQGGLVVAGLVVTSNLLLGDVVFLTSTGWNKSTTVANYQAPLGIVCGGRATDMKVVQDDALIGVMQVSIPGQEVLVGILGCFKSMSDLAVASMTRVTGGAVTAGRFTTTGIAVGNHVGWALDVTGAAGVVARVWVGGGNVA